MPAPACSPFCRPQLEELESRWLPSGSSLLDAPPLNQPVTSDAAVQQMPSLAVDPLDAAHVVIAYMDRSLVSTGYAGIGVAVSHDAGDTWQHTSVPLPAGFDQGAANPITRFDDQGRVFVSFMAATFLGPQPPLTNPDILNPDGSSDRVFGFQANNGVFVARSDDGGLSWDQPVAVVSHHYIGQDPVSFETTPDLAVDTFRNLPDGRSNPNYGNLYVAWSRLYAPGQFPGHPEIDGGIDVLLAVSRDGGLSWQTRLQEQNGIEVTVLQDPLNTIGAPALGIVDQVRLAIGPEGDIYESDAGALDFTVHHSTDGGVSFDGPDHTTGYRIAFGTSETTSPNTSGLPSNHFRDNIVRAIVADPTRPGYVYVADTMAITDALGNQIDAGDVIFAWSSDYYAGNKDSHPSSDTVARGCRTVFQTVPASPPDGLESRPTTPRCRVGPVTFFLAEVIRGNLAYHLRHRLDPCQRSQRRQRWPKCHGPDNG